MLEAGNWNLNSPLVVLRGRHGGLMVSELNSGLIGLGSSPGRGHCVVFLGKTLNSHSSSLHPGIQMGTGKFNAGGNPAMEKQSSRARLFIDGWEVRVVKNCDRVHFQDLVHFQDQGHSFLLYGLTLSR